MSSVVLVFSMLSLGRILISNLVVANLLMYSLPVMILLYLATRARTFFTLKVFLHEIIATSKIVNENHLCFSFSHSLLILISHT